MSVQWIDACESLNCGCRKAVYEKRVTATINRPSGGWDDSSAPNGWAATVIVEPDQAGDLAVGDLIGSRAFAWYDSNTTATGVAYGLGRSESPESHDYYGRSTSVWIQIDPRVLWSGETTDPDSVEMSVSVVFVRPTLLT